MKIDFSGCRRIEQGNVEEVPGNVMKLTNGYEFKVRPVSIDIIA